jgi:hypothetical protein
VTRAAHRHAAGRAGDRLVSTQPVDHVNALSWAYAAPRAGPELAPSNIDGDALVRAKIALACPTFKRYGPCTPYSSLDDIQRSARHPTEIATARPGAADQ